MDCLYQLQSISRQNNFNVKQPMFTSLGAHSDVIRGPDPVKLMSNRASCYVRKGILNLEKKYFKKHLSINAQQNILTRTMEWLRDATNALE